MLLTLLDSVTPVNPVQASKAYVPMLDTLAGIFIEVRPIQFENVVVPILVTPFGISIRVNFLHNAKAFAFIVLTLLMIDAVPLMPSGQRISVLPSLEYRMPLID